MIEQFKAEVMNIFTDLVKNNYSEAMLSIFSLLAILLIFGFGMKSTKKPRSKDTTDFYRRNRNN